MGCQVNRTTLLFSLEDDAVHGDRSGVTGSRTCTKCRDFQEGVLGQLGPETDSEAVRAKRLRQNK
jgi:hypothetical protein